MKNVFNLRRFATFGLVQTLDLRRGGVRVVAVLTVTFAVVGVIPRLVSQAQQSYVPAKVSTVSVQPSANGTVVSSVPTGGELVVELEAEPRIDDLEL